jgi:hypothetical protein
MKNKKETAENGFFINEIIPSLDDVVLKWEKTGLLDSVLIEKQKIKMSMALEIASLYYIFNNKEGDDLAKTMIFPVIIKILKNNMAVNRFFTLTSWVLNIIEEFNEFYLNCYKENKFEVKRSDKNKADDELDIVNLFYVLYKRKTLQGEIQVFSAELKTIVENGIKDDTNLKLKTLWENIQKLETELKGFSVELQKYDLPELKKYIDKVR